MKFIIGFLLATALVTTAGAAGAPHQFVDGASSIDALLDQLLTALSARDEAGMHRLRVTEQEYREIIIPGTVEPGKPPRHTREEASKYYWSMLNQKSGDVGRALLKQFGGHTYQRKDLSFTKGTRQFSWYIAHGDVRLKLLDDTGETQELRTGTIAEVDGSFKFIGFNTNN